MGLREGGELLNCIRMEGTGMVDNNSKMGRRVNGKMIMINVEELKQGLADGFTG